MKLTIISWAVFNALFTNLLVGYHCGKTATCIGPLFYLTIVVTSGLYSADRAGVRMSELH
jgi:hypothetical protein